MPKKKKTSKALKEYQESAVVEETKPCTTPKSVSNEIEEIFSGKKRKKPDKVEDNNAEKPESTTKKKKKKSSKEDREGRITVSNSKSKRKSKDGFTIYTEEELGINNSNAGGTPLCPFDCECCF